MRFLGSKTERVQVLFREKRIVAKSGERVVKLKGVRRLNLYATDPAGFHCAELPFEFSLGNRRTEPPPPHHDSAVIRWFLEGSSKISYEVSWALSLHSDLRAQI